MRQAFVNWLPEYSYSRFLSKQLLIIGCALLLALITRIPFTYAMLIIGSLILIFRFVLIVPTNKIRSIKRHPMQEHVTELKNPHGLLNHTIIVGVFPIILGSVLSFFI